MTRELRFLGSRVRLWGLPQAGTANIEQYVNFAFINYQEARYEFSTLNITGIKKFRGPKNHLTRTLQRNDLFLAVTESTFTKIFSICLVSTDANGATFVWTNGITIAVFLFKL